MSYDDGLPPGWGGLGQPEPVAEPSRLIPISAGVAVLLGGLLGGVLAAAVGFFLGLYSETDLLSLDATSPALIRFIIVSSFGQFVAMGALLLLFSRVSGTGSWRKDFGFEFALKDIYWMPLGTLVQVLSILLVAWVAVLLGVEVPSQEAAEAIEGSQSLLQTLGLFLLIVIAAPVVEEVLFRGLWLKAFLRRMGTTAAVITTSVLFGLAHLLDPSAAFLVPALILVGVVLAVVTLRTGRLGPAVMVHAGFNLTTFVILISPSLA